MSSAPQVANRPIRDAHATGSSTIYQSAWIVNDLDAAVAEWVRAGVGPFFVVRNLCLDATHRGRPTTFQVSFGLAQAGPMQIELVQQHDDRPSAYRDVYAPGQGGFHHIGRQVEDYDQTSADYVRQGMVMALEGDTGGVKYGYVDTRAEIGCMTEIVQPTPGNAELYAAIREAGATWDGVEMIREIALG
jgi:methylmalonyl-CoA/ethylmalonyl-CoA epimerase